MTKHSIWPPLLKFTAVAMVGVLTFMVIHSTLRNTVPGDTRNYVAEFNDVTGLRAGDDVRIAGVKVGRVDELELTGSTAEVAFTVQKSQRLFTSTRALIRYQNLVGQRYLALMPGAGSGKPLPGGARIPPERTEPSLDLSALLNGFEPLFSLLDPEKLNTLSGTIVQTLQGKAPALRSLLAQSAELTSNLAERDEVLGGVLTGLTDVLEHLSGKNAEFDRLLNRSKGMLDKLGNNSDALFESVRGIGKVSDSVIGLLREARVPVRENLRKFNDVASTFLDEGAAVEGTLRGLPGFLGGLARVSNYGSWLNLYACNLTIKIDPVPPDILQTVFGDKHTEVCR